MIEMVSTRQMPIKAIGEVSRAMELLLRDGPTRAELARKLVLLLANCAPFLIEEHEGVERVTTKLAAIASEADKSWLVAGAHRALRNGQMVKDGGQRQ
jgi:hypothetical protein